METTLAAIAIGALIAFVVHLIRLAESNPLPELRPASPVYLYERPEFHARAIKKLRDQNAADQASLRGSR